MTDPASPTVAPRGEYLVLSVQDVLYGLEAPRVQEIVSLPALTPVAEAPSYLAGLLNYRGAVIPVLDLGRRLGHPARRYQLGDIVVVVLPAEPRGNWHQLGLIVNQVLDVRRWTDEAIEPVPAFEGRGLLRARFLQGIVQLDERMVQLLALEEVLALPADDVPHLVGEIGSEASEPPAAEEGRPASTAAFCPEASEQDRAVFRDRARALTRVAEAEDVTGLSPFAVLELAGEFFGVDLELVREFTPQREPAPIPCCPSHILGALNLRGQILPLVDFRPPLHLPAGPLNPEGKIVILATSEWLLGVPVERVCDVVYLRPDAIRAVPTAVQSVTREWLRGAAPYADRMMAILDVRRMLAEGNLAVDEVV